MEQFFVYFLKEINGNRTYIGYTNNIKRRIRQHNSELKGGAKYTRGRQWEYIAYLTGFPNSIIALQCEWKLKHPFNKSHKSSGILSRLKSLQHIMTIEKFTSNSQILTKDLQLKLYIQEKYLPLELPSNISIEKIENNLININILPNELPEQHILDNK